MRLERNREGIRQKEKQWTGSGDKLRRNRRIWSLNAKFSTKQGCVVWNLNAEGGGGGMEQPPPYNQDSSTSPPVSLYPVLDVSSGTFQLSERDGLSQQVGMRRRDCDKEEGWRKHSTPIATPADWFMADKESPHHGVSKGTAPPTGHLGEDRVALGRGSQVRQQEWWWSSRRRIEIIGWWRGGD